ncbi:hypothetical protein ACF3DV_32650 [Chlorogloeopsis fritschii PCC 9212]|uniref:hypothetical protein n=1 Tax=Chlorogloeopsis fritschii TaxID=1124 RepID=UPI0002F05C1E|nr:hypothetical protein [Chlorogloeopsis fritschii]
MSKGDWVLGIGDWEEEDKETRGQVVEGGEEGEEVIKVNSSQSSLSPSSFPLSNP